MNVLASPASVLRILVADDHPVARQGILRVLECRRNISVVGEAADGLDAVDKVKTLAPDVAVLDISMPKLDGIDATPAIRAVTAAKVLLVTAHDGAEYVRQGLVAGATGYVPKFAQPGDIVDAVEAVAAGGTYIHPTLTERLFRPIALAEANPLPAC